jgi:hypothetical protein
MSVSLNRVPQNDLTRAEAQRIYEKHGALRETDIVEESRDPESPLHPYFMWDDDSGAAQMGRLAIAQAFVMRITVTIEGAPQDDIEPLVRVRKYNGIGKGEYWDIERILADDSARATLLRRALIELRAFKRRYERLKELAPVLSAIQAVEPAAGGGPTLERSDVPARAAARQS